MCSTVHLIVFQCSKVDLIVKEVSTVDYSEVHSNTFFFNRPGVARAVLHSPPSLINRLTKSSFVEIYSNHHNFQTVRARDLKF